MPGCHLSLHRFLGRQRGRAALKVKVAVPCCARLCLGRQNLLRNMNIFRAVTHTLFNDPTFIRRRPMANGVPRASRPPLKRGLSLSMPNSLA
eukprot:scaffold54096_cov33-Tisochrysis_lutea.AAC.6